jgi:hypothetical protein
LSYGSFFPVEPFAAGFPWTNSISRSDTAIDSCESEEILTTWLNAKSGVVERDSLERLCALSPFVLRELAHILCVELPRKD